MLRVAGDGTSSAPSPPVEVTDEHLMKLLLVFDLGDYHGALRAGKYVNGVRMILNVGYRRVHISA